MDILESLTQAISQFQQQALAELVVLEASARLRGVEEEED